MCVLRCQLSTLGLDTRDLGCMQQCERVWNRQVEKEERTSVSSSGLRAVLNLYMGIVGKLTGTGGSVAFGGLGARVNEDPGTDCAAFQLGCVGGGREGGAVGGGTKPLGPFGGSRAGSGPLGPVGSGGECSRILTSPSVSMAAGSSLTFPFPEGCESFDITVSGTDSALTGVRARLSLRLRLWHWGLRSTSGSRGRLGDLAF
jgi:hypothetical protein